VRAPAIHRGAFVAPGAQIHGDVTVDDGAVILFGVVMRAEFDAITVGRLTSVQDGVIVHCDAGFPTAIGDRVILGHAAVIHGAIIGNDTLVGVGARALNGSVLGEGAWLGAGAVLTEGSEIPPWTLGLGIPAKPIRSLRPDEVERQVNGVANYQRIGALYREQFTR
jgi:carbonic anhydrase/acetyltransferase-like protein (isoleucine patch superfamily)